MTNLLRANFFRLRKTLVVWGGFAVCVAMAAFTTYTHVSDHMELGVVFLLDTTFFIYTIIVGFLMSVVVSTTLGTEYSDGTIRNKLSVGHLRRDIYLSNLFSMTLASWLYCAVYMLAAGVLGIPFAGWLTVDWKIILITLAGSLLLEAAFCALYTAIAMNCSYKATTAIICILLFFAMMVASTYVFARLDAAPEHLAYKMVDGEFVSEMEPNPRYLQGTERAVCEFFVDLIPTGQAVRYYVLTFAHPLRMVLCALGITAVSTGAGFALFQRKDLK